MAFTSADILRDEDPDYFKPVVIAMKDAPGFACPFGTPSTSTTAGAGKSESPAATATGGNGPPPSTSSTASGNSGVMTRTWKYLLDTCCKRKEIPVDYQFVDDDNCLGVQFHCVCKILTYTGKGTATTKKAAQHLAAKSVLDQIIAGGRHLEFGIFGANQEDAAKYVSGLMQVEGVANPRSPPTAATTCDNAVSKLFERSAKLKVAAPEFEVLEESGPTHAPTFVVECRVGEHSAKAVARTKRDARTASATALLERLNQLGLRDRDPRQPVESDDQQTTTPASGSTEKCKEHWQTLLKSVHKSSINAFAVLEEIIKQRAAENDKNTVDARGEQPVGEGQHSFLVQPTVTTHQDNDGAEDSAHCILQFPDAANISFVGSGANVILATNAAAYNAIVYLRRYGTTNHDKTTM